MGKDISDVLVLGAGISGIQASLDLANCGYRVYLVDKSPALGGHMAQLDKVFPTNDCSMCIESPKFIECDRHPNIDILSYTEIDHLEGSAGDFRITLIKKPRYIIEEMCRGCGACTRYCPVNIPDGYNEDLSETKAVHIHFAQAVPLVTYIDPEACLFLTDGKCSICAGVCENRAVNFRQKPERIEIAVGAILLATGYEVFDPSKRSEYGYHKMANVITSLEYERILNSDGPFQGEIRRVSDSTHPSRIAWIQCVGSRQILTGGNSYCSSVCCMYAIKQLILTKEHTSSIETTIFHNDIRAHGKEFEQFYQRAKSLSGTRFIRSAVSIEHENPKTGSVSIKYSSDGSVIEEEFDMVILSAGITAPLDAKGLSEKLGIELNQHGFCRRNDHNPLMTSVPGIMASGAFTQPMNITDSVTTGSGAAALCGQLLSSRRGRLAREKDYPPERDISDEKAKVGVFVCHCGANIGSIVDIPAVVQYSSQLPNTIHAEEMLFACSTDAAVQIATAIREKGLNRIVVAACTPRTHEPLFQETLREAGINKYCFAMANIREHCSWAHSREKKKATEKAIDKVRMTVARAVNLSPLKEIELPVIKRGLVIGGGIAGMTSAESMARMGFEVCLIEKSSELGGNARRVHFTLEGLDVQSHLKELIRSVHQNPLIRIYTESTITKVSGYVGNFITTITLRGLSKEIEHGITIIATGAEEYKPTEYHYGKDNRILTLLDLEEGIARNDETITGARSIVMILCVGCRDEERPHCSRICCGEAVKCALKLKESNPVMDIYILYQDMRTYGFKEDYYREAADRGVTFIRYENQEKPIIEFVHENNLNIMVSVYDPVLGSKLAIDADIVALAAAVIPSNDIKEISRLYKVPLNRDGFFLEAHMKLRPVDCATEGIFLAGLAHFPKTIDETISQAYAAAGRAATILAKSTIISSGAVCTVNEDNCIGCGLCQMVCQYGAIEMLETTEGKKATVTAAACQSCGICNSVCPTGAISLNHFNDTQILAEIDNAFPAVPVSGHFEPKILAFLCNWCGYAGCDNAGVSRIQYTPHVREIRVMCTSRIHPRFIMHAFLTGIDGVLICGCHLGDCHYIKANKLTETMITITRKNLEKIGIKPERLRQEYISASEGARYAECVDTFSDYLKELGPINISEAQRQRLTKLKVKYTKKDIIL